MDNVDILNPIAQCGECREPLPDVRVKMNVSYCAYCQTEKEERQKRKIKHGI